MNPFTQFAHEATATVKPDIWSTLGVNWQLLLFQIVAFALLVVILGKWIFPIFFRIIDQRQAVIEESNRAAIEATEKAEKAQEAIEKLLKQARTEAKEIVATAKEEADAMAADAETKSKTQAERIVAAAHDEIAKDVIAAKKALHNETIDLVASATEKVVGKIVDAKADGKLIAKAVEESK